MFNDLFSKTLTKCVCDVKKSKVLKKYYIRLLSFKSKR